MLQKLQKVFTNENPETTVRILHLSMNIYKPTLKMLEVFYQECQKDQLL